MSVTGLFTCRMFVVHYGFAVGEGRGGGGVRTESPAGTFPPIFPEKRLAVNGAGTIFMKRNVSVSMKNARK